MNCCSTRWPQWIALVGLLLALPAAAAAQQSRPGAARRPKPINPAFAPVQDDPQLPRVLLLGDSISIGYTVPVRTLLAGKANVHRALENCGPTTRGLARLERWLGDGSWDVIHFNFGLHDLAHVDDAGARVGPDQGHLQVPLAQYEENLRRIVLRLRETGAALIWATTTPVPAGARSRKPEDVGLYNEVAARVMRMVLGEERVVDDLYALAAPRLAEIQRPANVHFTPAGSKELATAVARVIEQHLPRARPADAATVTGVVFHDADGDGTRDDGERLLAGVRVSNGREIVRTDQQGRYRLAVDDDTIVFVIKPRGWRSPVRANMLPHFYYIHKPQGSPASKFPGVAPTGPLPESVDFPLYEQEEPARFKAILFGDPQPRDQKEVDYVTHDVVEELIGTDASFGVTLGDIVFDNLDLFEPQARAISVLGIPWYNVIGNHDMNYDARRDRDSDESFARVFGPSYYSFDYGPVHFLVLDDVEWLIDEQGKGLYQGGFGADQVAFVERDLALIPADQLVVLMMHIPLTDVRDRQRLYRLIEQRPFCMSISAHRHVHEHRFITRQDGWRGPEPHHHLINVTVCGSWWSGMPDERGIPHTLMADGAPNGYSIMTFDGHEYQLDFKAAGRPSSYQMNIYAAEVVPAAESGQAEVLVNVFNGSPRSTVELAVGPSGNWSAMERVLMEDPAFKRVRATEAVIRDKLAAGGGNPDDILRQLTKVKLSTHIWRATLPASLAAGSHALRVRATDTHGRRHIGYRIVRVVP